MRRRKHQMFLACQSGMFLLNRKPIGTELTFRVAEIEYWLLKWLDGRVKRRKFREGCRWPEGYSISADLIIVLEGQEVCFTLYGQDVDLIPASYLVQLPIGGGVLAHDALTYATCQCVDGMNRISLQCVT
ncbi:hypothetical protein [Halodesulfovibrio sp.]|uniref:hypothetical protein n=1 Tax=Halodesulfovibrio sp. TaxID=1912772 RepID=UPI0025BF6DD2|nr:hypothetical protein [Halodesulfovibrio sp.]